MDHGVGIASEVYLRNILQPIGEIGGIQRAGQRRQSLPRRPSRRVEVGGDRAQAHDIVSPRSDQRRNRATARITHQFQRSRTACGQQPIDSFVRTRDRRFGISPIGPVMPLASGVRPRRDILARPPQIGDRWCEIAYSEFQRQGLPRGGVVRWREPIGPGMTIALDINTQHRDSTETGISYKMEQPSLNIHPLQTCRCSELGSVVSRFPTIRATNRQCRHA